MFKVPELVSAPFRGPVLRLGRRCWLQAEPIRSSPPTSVDESLSPAQWWSSCRATRLNGSEIYCLRKKGFRPHHLVLGSAAQSMGMINGFLSSWSQTQGGSNAEVTGLISSARQTAMDKLMAEAVARGGAGVVGTSLQLVHKASHFEVVAIGSTVVALEDHEKCPPVPIERASPPTERASPPTEGASPRVHSDWLSVDEETHHPKVAPPPTLFVAGCSGEQFYCLLECGFTPKTVVFGNDAYSRGLGGFFRSAVASTISSGEVPAISDVFNQARNAALYRLCVEAHEQGCPFVSGVQMQASNWSFLQEVAVRGTACTHSDLRPPASPEDVMTSSLPEADLWACMDCGMLPVGVVTRTSVFNVGFGGMLKSWGQEMRGGEITRYNEVLEAARAHVMDGIYQDALALGADEIIGLELDIVEVANGLVEFHAYGTAVRSDLKVYKPEGSTQLPAQALHVSRQAFTEVFGRRGVGASPSGEGDGQASIASASAEQANAGYSAINLGLNLLNSFVKPREK
jgi:uncharacterized protein YbjQ (UPF0145 family)